MQHNLTYIRHSTKSVFSIFIELEKTPRNSFSIQCCMQHLLRIQSYNSLVTQNILVKVESKSTRSFPLYTVSYATSYCYALDRVLTSRGSRIVYSLLYTIVHPIKSRGRAVGRVQLLKAKNGGMAGQTMHYSVH